jgi:hypothetical protein
MSTKNPIMVAAGKKAAATRRKNKEAEHQKWVRAGRKAWETRRKNQGGTNRNARTEKLTLEIISTLNQTLKPLGYKVVKS